MGGRSDGWGGNSDQSSDHLRNLGNYLKNDYKDASHALKADPAYIKRKNSKPKKRRPHRQVDGHSKPSLPRLWLKSILQSPEDSPSVQFAENEAGQIPNCDKTNKSQRVNELF